MGKNKKYVYWKETKMDFFVVDCDAGGKEPSGLCVHYRLEKTIVIFAGQCSRDFIIGEGFQMWRHCLILRVEE